MQDRTLKYSIVQDKTLQKDRLGLKTSARNSVPIYASTMFSSSKTILVPGNKINLLRKKRTCIYQRARTFGRGTVRRGTVHRKKKILVSARLG